MVPNTHAIGDRLKIERRHINPINSITFYCMF